MSIRRSLSACKPTAGTYVSNQPRTEAVTILVNGRCWAHSRFPGHALTPTGVMAIRCKQFHLPDL